MLMTTEEMLQAVQRNGYVSCTLKITAEEIKQAALRSGYGLCKGHFGSQSDIQSFGYDSLCALAILQEGDSYARIDRAMKLIAGNCYCAGFQKGWDGGRPELVKDDEKSGWDDGREASSHFGWRRTTHSDGIGR